MGFLIPWLLNNDEDYYAYNPDTHCELALRLTTTEDEALGVLNVESSTVGAFDEDLPDVVKILTRLADTLVNAIANSRRRARNQAARGMASHG